MSNQRLSDYFDGFAIKRLSAVETDPHSSNQHELNSVRPLRDLLGTEKIKFAARFIYLSEEETENTTASAQLTWYDSRRGQPARSPEYRLYFESNSVLDEANAGDLLFIGKTPADKLIVVVAEAHSSAENQLLWLFRLGDSLQDTFYFAAHPQFQNVDISFVERHLLEQLGITTVTYQGELLDLIIKRFGSSFPRTRDFSAFARSLVAEADPIADPDGTLLRWLDQEEILFRTLERHIVSEKLEEGFNNDVDEFVSYSLGVQNRRKSRAGHAFENHIEQLLLDNQINHSRGCMTENKSKPDFIFPGIEAYNDSSFSSSGLTMLAAKTSCKDRWRQVLSEAKRIELRHLISLEPGITENQTDEMRANSVQLIVPKDIHASYSVAQSHWLYTLGDFIDHIAAKQPKPGFRNDLFLQ